MRISCIRIRSNWNKIYIIKKQLINLYFFLIYSDVFRIQNEPGECFSSTELQINFSEFSTHTNHLKNYRHYRYYTQLRWSDEQLRSDARVRRGNGSAGGGVRGFYLPISLISFCRVLWYLWHKACWSLPCPVSSCASNSCHTLPQVVGRDRPPKVRHSKLIRNLRALEVCPFPPVSFFSWFSLLPHSPWRYGRVSRNQSSCPPGP